MKALQKWFGRRGALPLTAYLAALAVWVVLGAFHLGSDSLARAQGRLTEETMAATDWQLVGLTPNEDGTLTTVDGDPQMILENVGDRVVRTISYTAQFDGEARELCLYYTTKVARITLPTAGCSPGVWAKDGTSTRCPAPVWPRCGSTPAARRKTRP